MNLKCSFRSGDPDHPFKSGIVLAFTSIGTLADYATLAIVKPDGQRRPIEVHISELLLAEPEEEIEF